MSTLDEFLKKVPAEQHALVRSLDAVISKAAPDLTTSLKWGNLTYQGAKIVCSVVSHRNHVNVQLWAGAELDDPTGLLEGTGKEMRHIKVSSEADLVAKVVAGFVKQAARLRGA